MANTRLYTLKGGDTLYWVALLLLADGSRWKEIAALNDMATATDWTPGQTIQVPAQ